MQKQVLIVECRETLRKGLRTIFVEGPDVVQVYETTTSEGLRRQLECHTFDLVVIHQSLVTDITMLPPGNFVLLATEPQIEMLFAAHLYKARGYFLENVSGDLLQQTLQNPQGAFLTDPAMSKWIAEYLAHHTLLAISDQALTLREREIFHLLWSGMSKCEMAQHLCISQSTIKTHVKHIYEKFRLNRRQVNILSLLTGDDGKERLSFSPIHSCKECIDVEKFMSS